MGGDRTALELLWGGAPRASRGPRPALNLDRIVRAAIEIADADGIDAVSMQRVANALGFTTMSLYRHVPGKEQLVEVMVDVASGAAPRIGDDLDWRAGVEAWMRSIWAVYRRHPWLPKVPMSGPPMGPNQLTWFEAILKSLSRLDLRGEEMISIALFAAAAVRDLARISADMVVIDPADPQPDGGYDELLRRFADPERYPTLAAIVAGGTFQPVPGEVYQDLAPDLEFGMQRLLDGIEAYARRTR